jgi:serine/threonine protein kinase
MGLRQSRATKPPSGAHPDHSDPGNDTIVLTDDSGEKTVRPLASVISAGEILPSAFDAALSPSDVSGFPPLDGSVGPEKPSDQESDVHLYHSRGGWDSRLDGELLVPTPGSPLERAGQRRVSKWVDDGYYKTEDEKNHFESWATSETARTRPPRVFGPGDVKRGALLGSGAFGKVYYCLDNRSGELIAAKVVPLNVQWVPVPVYREEKESESTPPRLPAVPRAEPEKQVDAARAAVLSPASRGMSARQGGMMGEHPLMRKLMARKKEREEAANRLKEMEEAARRKQAEADEKDRRLQGWKLRPIMDDETAAMIQSLETEIALMASLRHRNVVRYLGTRRDRPNVSLPRNRRRRKQAQQSARHSKGGIVDVSAVGEASVVRSDARHLEPHRRAAEQTGVLVGDGMAVMSVSGGRVRHEVTAHLSSSTESSSRAPMSDDDRQGWDGKGSDSSLTFSDSDTDASREGSEGLPILEDQEEDPASRWHLASDRSSGSETTHHHREHGSTFTIFMEFVPGGSIRSVLDRVGPLDERVIRVYCKQLLHALTFLHGHRIVHRDIKGANLLVDGMGFIKVADFGASSKLADVAVPSDKQNPEIRGTPLFMAPEVITQVGHGRKADIWSAGCTVIEMASGRPPWVDVGFENELAAMFHIATTASLPTLPDSLSPLAKDFVTRCLTRDPALRPTAHELLKHPFIASNRTTLSPPRRVSVPKVDPTGDVTELKKFPGEDPPWGWPEHDALRVAEAARASPRGRRGTSDLVLEDVPTPGGESEGTDSAAVAEDEEDEAVVVTMGVTSVVAKMMRHKYMGLARKGDRAMASIFERSFLVGPLGKEQSGGSLVPVKEGEELLDTGIVSNDSDVEDHTAHSSTSSKVSRSLTSGGGVWARWHAEMLHQEGDVLGSLVERHTASFSSPNEEGAAIERQNSSRQIKAVDSITPLEEGSVRRIASDGKPERVSPARLVVHSSGGNRSNVMSPPLMTGSIRRPGMHRSRTSQ